MQLVKIYTDRESLIDQHASPTKEYPWHTLSKATISRATPTLFDELSIVFDTPDGQVYVTEVDPGFAPLIEALTLDKQLPEDWYVQVEAGRVFTVSLPNSN
ncbi:MAG: hypothetical protein MI756_19325 [Chromatiales bacterium]|nr:hypothetical protein [Chromatiales bacterium]